MKTNENIIQEIQEKELCWYSFRYTMDDKWKNTKTSDATQKETYNQEIKKTEKDSVAIMTEKIYIFP